MNKIILVITIASCLLFACNNAKDSKETESTSVADSTLNTSATNPEAATQMPSTDASGTLPATIEGASIQQQPATATAAGMNPAHGEPGHRCDIAVGSPLNSPPGQKPAAPATISNITSPSSAPSPVTISAPASTPALTPTVTPSSGAPTTTAPGMNPPHGEPGHDCKIAVGAPLKK